MVNHNDELKELQQELFAQLMPSAPEGAWPEGVEPLLGQLDAVLDKASEDLAPVRNTVEGESPDARRQAVQAFTEAVLWACLQAAREYKRQLAEQDGERVRSVGGALVSYVSKRLALALFRQPTFAVDAPRISVKTLIILGDKTDEGTLVKGVSALWFEIMRRIMDDPDSIHKIGCWRWEELLAGAYKQDGWETVVLTPKRGDHGIDVIAERKGWGQLRFLLLDQMKAYKPGHLIGPDEIREMKGVLLDHPEASKGLITTTADFTPGALEAAANLAPRLELRPRDKLAEWLASVAVENLGASDAIETEGPTNA